MSVILKLLIYLLVIYLIYQNKTNIMNKYFILICFLWAISCNQKQESSKTLNAGPATPFDDKTELAAIMKVIDNETKMFFDGNVEGWRATWSHQDYASQAWNNDDGTAAVAHGWDAINKQGSEWIQKYYKNGEVVIHPDYKRGEVKVHFFSDDIALIHWKQYNADKEKKYYRVSDESRIMEKENDVWKIVNVTALWDVENKISVDSLPAL
jgi:hypothetical protein